TLYAQAERNATALTKIAGPLPPCPPSLSFHANPNPVQYGDPLTLSWEISGCPSFDILLTGQKTGGAVETISPPPPATVWSPSDKFTAVIGVSAKFTLTA